MYCTFNMVIGMCLFVGPEDADHVLQICKKEPLVIGKFVRQQRGKN
ncbi:MAG: AIR synthase-related protein [Candidatus Bathyarchaeia archaeon]